jgi:hypothetical protein
MLDAPLLLLLLTAREGRLRLNSTVQLTRYRALTPFAPPAASLRSCAPTTKLALFLPAKLAKLRAFYSGANIFGTESNSRRNKAINLQQ